MGGVRGTGDVMRDARLPVRKKIEGRDGLGGLRRGGSVLYPLGTEEAAIVRAGREW